MSNSLIFLYPSSNLASNKQTRLFIEQPGFELHDIYRTLSVLAEENDFIQAELYKNSQKVINRRKDILYYDCTNYYFELEEADDLRRYGKGKQHQPLPLVGMGLFIDYDGIPLAFDIYPGNKSEQPILKPLEKKVLHDYGLDQIIDKIYYKDRWIKEDLSQRKIKNGAKPLEQHLIVSFSLKYQQYQRKIRQEQIERAQVLIDSGRYKQRPKNQNDPHRFIGHQVMTDSGEACSIDIPFLSTEVITEEERYDGFYAVCTNVEDMGIAKIIRINKKRWEIEECFRILKTDFKARPVYLQTEDHIKAHFITCYFALLLFRVLEKKLGERYTCEEILNTLKGMMVSRPGEKLGYIPAYTRTDLTDALHETFGFRTDYEITTDVNMKKILRNTKGKSNNI